MKQQAQPQQQAEEARDDGDQAARIEAKIVELFCLTIQAMFTDIRRCATVLNLMDGDDNRD